MILKLAALIGFNERMTFQGKVGWLILNRIHIKEAVGCNSERGSPQEDEELIILWFCDLHKQREAEAERELERKKGGRGEKTSVEKKKRF